jgi:hypothetical protein
MDLGETGYENGRWIKLAQGCVHWQGAMVLLAVVGESSYCNV